MKLIKSLLSSVLIIMVIAPCSADNANLCTFADVSAKCNQINYRKNIDELTADELAAYQHAVAAMKAKSAENIYDRTGFLWQAWVHNCTNVIVTDKRKISSNDISKIDSCDLSDLVKKEKNHREYPGMCEHAKDTFFQWHRAEFYFYEKSLQAADPEGKTGPSTKNVTVPYWNFTKKPTGARYPKVYEDTSSPLYVAGRNQQPLSSPLPYTSPYLLAYQIYFLDWQSFGGYSVGGAGNYGDFEAQIHNNMHSDYVGGFMDNPRTAGLDPLFYAFHAYLDYIFERWIEEHGTDTITGSKIFLRSEQDGDLQKPIGFTEGTGEKRPGNFTKNMSRGEIYFDTRLQGYAYQPGRDGEFIPKAIIQSIIDKHQQAGFLFGENKMSLFSELLSYGTKTSVTSPGAILKGEITVPAASFTNATLNIVRSSKSPDYSFQTDVYLHPQDVTADIASKDFRDRYLVASTSYWALSNHHDHSNTAEKPLIMPQDITDVINSLRNGKKDGQKWQITLAISSKDKVVTNQFEKPTITIQ